MVKLKKLLESMELIHYIEKFKNKVFIVLVTGEGKIKDIIPDIIVLQSFNIKIVLVIGYNKENIENLSKEVLEISSMLKYYNLDPLPSIGTEVFTEKNNKITGFDTETIEFAVNNNKIPIIAPIGMDKRGKYHILDEKILAQELASEVKSEILFYVSEVSSIILENKEYKFLSYDDMKNLMSDNQKIKRKYFEILNYAKTIMDTGIKNFAVIKSQTGNLYGEILTYDISGSLISKIDDELIRKADISDVFSIYLLIKNESQKNNILAVTEKEIEKNIDDYMVYEIDKNIVAAGKLTDYGEWVELAKVVTLARYKGGQKSKKVCVSLIEKAITEGKKYVFGLTINDVMAKLFLGLGFQETKREKLPEKWEKNYDFLRKSNAYVLDISGDINE